MRTMQKSKQTEQKTEPTFNVQGTNQINSS